MARRYYRLKSVAAIETYYKQRLKETEAHSNMIELERLQNERHRALSRANKLTKGLAAARPDQNTESAKQELLLLWSGDVKKLIERSPETLLMFGSITENNLAGLYRDVGRIDDARVNYEQARKHRQELVANYSAIYLPELAETLSELGDLDREQKRMDEALQELNKALEIRRELANKTPERYYPYVAITLRKLGDLYRDQNDFDRAHQAYEEAFNIYERYVTSSPEQYSNDVAAVKHILETLDCVPNQSSKRK